MPEEETYEEWLSRRCDEAEANEKGWISNERSKANFLKLREEYRRKHYEKMVIGGIILLAPLDSGSTIFRP